MGALDNMLAGKRQERTTTGALDRMIEASKQEQTGTQTAPRSVAAMRKSAEYRGNERSSHQTVNRADAQRRAQAAVVSDVIRDKKSGLLGGAVRGWLGGQVSAAASGLETLQAADWAVSQEKANIDASRRNIENYTVKRDAAQTAEERARWQQLIDRNERLIAINNEAYAKKTADVENAVGKLGETRAKLKSDAEYGIAKEKESLGTIGRTAVDVGVAGGQMAMDALAGGLPSIASRVFGDSTQEAKEAISPDATTAERMEGKTKAFAYGAGSAAVSVATEKLANIAAPFKRAFGGGVLDKALEGAVAKMGGSAAGKAALSFLSEGGEEMLEDVVQPVLQSIYNGKSVGENYSELELQDVLYDGLIGGILGLAGSGLEIAGNAVTRGEYEKYRLKTAEELAAQKKAAPTAESGVQTETAPKYLKTVEEMVAEKNAASEETAGNGENMRLSDEDLPDYLGTGGREHTRNEKKRMLNEGNSPILSTPEAIRTFIADSVLGKIRNTIKAYGRVGKRLSADIEAESAGTVNVADYYLELEANHMKHLAEHADNDGDPRNMPLTREQVYEIPEYIDGYDDVLKVTKSKDGKTRVYLGKRINGHSVVVVLASKERSSLHPVTAWQNTTEHYLRTYGKKKTQVDTSQTHSENGYRPSGSKPTSSEAFFKAPVDSAPDVIRTSLATEEGDAGHQDTALSVDTTVPQSTAGVNAQDMQGSARYAQEGPRYLKTAEEIMAERAAAEEASYRQAEQSDEGYMDALARDKNLFEEALTPSDRIYAMKLDELQTREAPPEKSRTDVEKRDVDELAELYAAAANPVSTARDARFEASEGLVKAKTAEERKTAKDRAEDVRSFFMRKMVDAGDSVTRVAKATGDRYLYPYYNMARSSASAGINMIAGEQTDVTGKRVGKSLNDIFQPIRKLGDDYYNAFQLYLFDLHNADRMSLVTGENTAKLEAELALKDFDRNNPDVATLAEERLRRNASDADPDVAELAKERLRLLRRVNQADRMGNKPVFSYEVTADMSRERADRLVREHPEFEQYRAEVRKYIDNLMQYRVDSGLMTQEDAAFLKRYYPNYVPTFRAVEKGGRGRDRRSVQVGKTVGRAEGGTQKLVPLHEALGKQTMSVVREGSKNRFGQRLLDDYMNSRAGSEARRYVRDAQEFDADFSAETFDQTDPTLRRENTFSVYKDGKKWDMTVDESMFDAVKALSPDAKESSVAVTAIRSANNLFKSLVTGYNPTFLVRNTIRDLQTAGLYSRDGKAFAQNYPLALKEIRTDGEYWKQYKALGGSFSSVFDYRTGTVKEQTGKAAKLLGKLETLNMATEQAPRLAEFMSVVKAGDGSMSNLMDAMHAAADVTVNFGRAGTLGKVLNANFVPFLNPGIQGFDKMIRRVTETQGAKEWASLVVRAAVLGIAPTLINAALYSDDDEWDDIRDSDKDTNYLFKLGDGVWLKIPKGRELSLLGMTADRIGDIVNGESVDWRDFITTAGNQVAPANPLKSNIFSAYADADLFDPSSPGKTWYGGDIESQRLRKYAPGERYDSSTDVVSKWIGEQLGLSPKKINYLLDQYTGVVGDFVLPLLTPQAERGMFEKAFTLDSVSNNRISGEFYDESDELTYAKNGGDDTAAVVSRFWSKQAAACAGIYAEIRKTENSNLTNAEKKQKVREAKAVLNGIQKNALALEETYRKAAEKAVRETNDTDDAYREANRECFGAEYALEVYNKDVYAKAKEAHEGGIEYDTYYDYYFAAKELKADKDRNGKTINGSKREKVLKLIDSMELSDYQKDVLYLTEGYSEKTIDDAPWNQSEYEKYRLKLPKYELPEYELPKYELEVKLLPRP